MPAQFRCRALRLPQICKLNSDCIDPIEAIMKLSVTKPEELLGRRRMKIDAPTCRRHSLEDLATRRGQ